MPEQQYAYVTTIGRKSGQKRQIEIWFVEVDGLVYILAEHGYRANWVRNVLKNPDVSIRIGEEESKATARIVDAEAEPELYQRARGRSNQKYKWGDGLPVEIRRTYRISTDPARLDIPAIHSYLSRSYWAEKIQQDIVKKSMSGSLCFGLFDGDRQIGLARVITDRATFAYLCDVYVLEEFRGKGLGTWLIEVVLRHPDLEGLRRFSLVTRDAHRLYEKFGFSVTQHPERHMEILRRDVYKA